MKFLIAAVVLMATMAGAADLEVGQPAPDFAAQSTGGDVKLADYSGKWLILYFYPKSFTLGCTKEACSLRDNSAELGNLKATVLGCSYDTLSEQNRFKKEHNLPFELIADTNKVIAKAYGAAGKLLPIPDRKTFIINPDGKIAKVYPKVNVEGHAAQLQVDLKALQDAK